MDTTLHEFEQLMQRARGHCPKAAQEVFDRYGPAVRRVVRRRLHRRLRRHYDSEDLTQSVWASFFQIPAERYSFPTPQALIAFLSQAACHKVMLVTRQRTGTRKYDVSREQSLDAPHPKKGCAVGETVPDRVATPSQYVIAGERWERLIEGLKPGHVRALELLREGHSHVDVARMLGVHRKVIQRLLEQLHRHMDAP
jgi:RNA polymerase sigma-70 factor (ECF subfamily)